MGHFNKYTLFHFKWSILVFSVTKGVMAKSRFARFPKTSFITMCQMIEWTVKPLFSSGKNLGLFFIYFRLLVYLISKIDLEFCTILNLDHQSRRPLTARHHESNFKSDLQRI